ncbi:MAG: anthrone oxygenase family protein [Polyangiales bacterium]
MMSFWLLVVTSDAAQAWTRYTVPWTKWNHVRTVACIAAAAAFIAALFA